MLGVLCSSLILLSYYNRSFQLQANLSEKLDRNLQSVIALALADTTSQIMSRRFEYDLFGKGEDSVSISKSPWGIYDIAVVKAWNRHEAKTKKLLYGATLPSYFDGSLYLVDHDNPLSVVGHSSLIGDAYLPKAGARIAYIDQRGFDGTTLVNGVTKNGGKTAPSLNNAIIQYLYSLLRPKQDTGVIRLIAPASKDTIFQSFQDSALSILTQGNTVLSNIVIYGQVIIRSDSLIEIDSTAILENCLLIAPGIKIKTGFAGTIQAIASDSIIVEGNCILKYPSALVLLKGKGQSIQNGIEIMNNCTIEGAVFSIADTSDELKTKVEIGDQSLINGIVYVQGYLSMHGTINGTVLTDYFIYRKSASVYLNHLVDAVINRKKMSAYYVGPNLFTGKKSQKIIQWLQ